MKIPYLTTNYLDYGLTRALLEIREFNLAMEYYLDVEKLNPKFITNNNDYDIQRNTRGRWVVDFSSSFPNMLRSSNLINIMTQTEIYFKSFADQILLDAESPFLLKDLKGNSDFEKVKIVLRKVANIDFSEIDQEWTFIDNSRLMRNRFVHSRGIMSSNINDFSKISKFIDANKFIISKYLEDENYFHIVLEREFIFELIRNIFSLVQKIKKLQ